MTYDQALQVMIRLQIGVPGERRKQLLIEALKAREREHGSLYGYTSRQGS